MEEPRPAGPPPQQRIAEAALGLISERGLAGVTMSAIAQEARVARQTLYNHYPDVESIVIAVIEQHGALGEAQARQLLAGHVGAAAKLEQLIRHSVTMGAHGHALVALESSLSSHAQQELGAHRGRTEEIVKEILQEGVVEGVFRSDLDLEADAAFIREIVVSSVDPSGIHDVSWLAGAAVRFVLAAVTASPG